MKMTMAIKQDDSYASDLGMESENSEWKPVIHDMNSHQFVVPNGTMGQRWEEGKKWNLKLENEDGSKIDPDVNGRRHIRTKTIQFLTLIVKVTVFLKTNS